MMNSLMFYLLPVHALNEMGTCKYQEIHVIAFFLVESTNLSLFDNDNKCFVNIEYNVPSTNLIELILEMKH